MSASGTRLSFPDNAQERFQTPPSNVIIPVILFYSTMSGLMGIQREDGIPYLWNAKQLVASICGAAFMYMRDRDMIPGSRFP
jgi:hypothetical protein